MEELQEFITIKQLCEELSISHATGKNWLKLNKLTPQKILDKEVLFSLDYLNKLKIELSSNDTKPLKSRRNKKFISGFDFYDDYIDKKSPNFNSVKKITEIIKNYNLLLNNEQIEIILAQCALQLAVQRLEKTTDSVQVLSKYLDDELSFDNYDFLFDSLILSKNNANKFIKNNPELFKIKFTYQPNEDTCGFLYMSIKNFYNKKKNGAYYTPTQVVKKLIKNLPIQKDKTVFDPCCGSGNFLLNLNENIPITNIFGNDCDETAIKITRINLSLKYKCPDKNLLLKNFTHSDFLLSETSKKYDFILGNPPWGGEFNSELKLRLEEKFCVCKKNYHESFSLFIEKALNILTSNGILSFVLPESLLAVKSHIDIRKLIYENSTIDYIEYLGNIFDNVHCPSIILQLSKNEKFTTYGLKIKKTQAEFIIRTKRNTDFHNFNFKITDEEYKIIKKIESLKNITYLKNQSTFALGIVTGDNSKYISQIKTKTNERIVKGKDIKPYKILPNNNYIEFAPEKFQQCADEKIYRKNEKLLYKFVSDKLVFCYDNNKLLPLNSCNVLIPEIPNINIKYVMAVLNSKIINFYYQKKFSQIKVLRSNLEKIPIAVPPAEIQENVIKLVNKILSDNNQSNISEYTAKLDEIISGIYDVKLV